MKLTTAQAIVKYLIAQRTTIDGARGAAVPRRVRDLRARQRHVPRAGAGGGRRTNCRPGAARTSRAWRSPPSASPRRCAAARSWSPRRRSDPGATNMVTAAAVAHANRLPVLLLSGDTFRSRIPDPVLQQVEHFHDPSMSVNDAFKAVTRYWDRIATPEQVVHSLPHAVATMLDPADCGPAFLGLPQDVQAEALRLSRPLLRRRRARDRPAARRPRASWTRPRRRSAPPSGR